MAALVAKWGNSAAVRIPANLLEAAGLTLNSAVELAVEAGRIVIKPSESYSLNELLAGINQNNLHSETEWGAAQGKEEW